MGQVLSVGWYRLRATLRRRWSGYLGVVLLIGLIGGIAMASVAGARRTQSSYPTFLRSVNPSDLGIAIFNGTGGGPPTLTDQIARLPGVKRVRAVVGPDVVVLEPDGAPEVAGLGDFTPIGSTDGEFSEQDRLAAIAGTVADQARANQVMMTPSAAQFYKVRVGQVIALGLYTPAEEALPGFGTSKVRPRLRVEARLVGIVELSNEVVQDDIDRAYGFVFVTAAFVREASAVTAISPSAYEMVLDKGASSVPAVEQELIGLVPRGYTYEFHVTAPVVTEVQLAVKPESVALGAFGAIAALVCLVLAGQAISRQVSSEEDERRVLWSFGASRAVTLADALIGILAAVAIGSLLALVVAVALSPLAPIGPVRAVYPDRGIAFDWTVLGAGLVALVVGLGALALVVSLRAAPSQRADRPARIRRLECREGCGGDRNVSGKCRGLAARARAGPAARRGAGALHPGRHRARRDTGRGHLDVLERSHDACDPSRPLRLGLELHAQRQQQRASAGTDPLEPRSRRRGLVGCRLLRRGTRRRDRSGHPGESGLSSVAADPVGARARGEQPDRDRRRHLEPACTSESATPFP